MLPSCVRLLLGGEALADLLVERDQADGVLLVDHQVAQGRGQADAVLELRQLLAVGVAHRPGEVHHEVAGEVGLGLELLDVEPVGLGEDRPVDVGDVVARGVLAVLGELDREPLERAGVQPRDEPLDDELGAQVEPRDLADHLGLEVFLGGAGQGASFSSEDIGKADREAGQERRLVDFVDGQDTFVVAVRVAKVRTVTVCRKRSMMTYSRTPKPVIVGPLRRCNLGRARPVGADDLEDHLGDAVGDLGRRADPGRDRRRCRRSGRCHSSTRIQASDDDSSGRSPGCDLSL